MAGEVVACFEVLTTTNDSNEIQNSIDIYGNDQFYLGRSSALCRHSWSEPTISNKHVRIHCILYEQDPVADIAPMVYATDVSTNGTYLKKGNRECVSSQSDRGVRMGRKNGSYLLDDRDELRISDSVTLIYRSRTSIEEHKFTPIQDNERRLFASRYLITGRLLGKGGYGKVLIGIHQKTQRQLACKVINLRHLYQKSAASTLQDPTINQEEASDRDRIPSKVTKCFREFNILKDINHPNIITIEKAFWSKNSIYIFQELVTGGDLFSYIEYKGGRLLDVEAAVIIRQVLKGVEYLHKRGIVHRDLKPDNVLMTSLEDGARIVITDFGNARFLPKGQGTSSLHAMKRQRMFSLVGTLEYVAPEVHKANNAIPIEQGYSCTVDMWSIGAITVALLSGDVMFIDRTHPDYITDPRAVILALASKCDLSVLDDNDHAAWSQVGARPKDFIRSLLVLQEEYRMTATDALLHPWFSNGCHATEFEALYDRSVKDWQPRHKVFRLVEPITKNSTSIAAAKQSKAFLSQEIVSRFFPLSPERRPVHNIHETLSTSQRWRSNTPLPSIREEYEGGYYDRSSQVPRKSYDANDSLYHTQRNYNKNDATYQKQQPYTNTRSGDRSVSTRIGRQESIGNSMNQLSLDSGSPGLHSVGENGGEGQLYGPGETMNQHSDETRQQDGYSIYDQLPQTPELGSGSIVYETPPRATRKHSHSPTSPIYDLPSCASMFAKGARDNLAAPAHNIEDRSKRRKISHQHYCSGTSLLSN